MKELVVGGAGYVGSHACLALAQAGHEVTVYDDLSTGHSEAVQWGELVRASLDDAWNWQRAPHRRGRVN